jgi:hypothetical protein
MLYLFGRLALSDSLDYHENLPGDDVWPATEHERPSAPEPEACAAERQRRRGTHLPQADRASTTCLGK